MMDSDSKAVLEAQKLPQPQLQIYSNSNGEISPFWREKYEREAKKYWDIFYKRHQDKFFKDRHYLDKEWGQYFSGTGKKVILEVGCGAGNTIFPLAALYPEIFVHACDFSPRAVNLVKTHKEFTESRINAFVCDLTLDDLSERISPSSVDVVTMIFVLSAVSPDKMQIALQNIRKVLKPNGKLLFRDYATGDLAQERLSCKEQKISENFYVRGDGTRAFYFSDEYLTNLFRENGFETEEHVLCCKQVENRSREIVMNRRWVQAVFRLIADETATDEKRDSIRPQVKDITPKSVSNELEVDMSEGMASEIFGTLSSSDEIIDVIVRDQRFMIKMLSKEYQHTCKSTGLMLWESARLMASVLAANQSIVAGKRVLELGCGCAGICSMIASESADLVVATDGDEKALDLLNQNVASNVKATSQVNLVIKKLEWGNREDIQSIKELNDKGFEVIIGTDVTYIPEAISPLFATAAELIASSQCNKEGPRAAFILCHVFRRVDEPSLLTAAAQFGFTLVDRWPKQNQTSSPSIISSWFSEDGSEDSIPTKALHILYFTRK
ncbi:OLC1v1029280C1 [Oldenlandia corymbosa var. corymbosa]|uniref:OLC1v1029280C1 n=1 Tax=Oldenlandia corymbosa var. corymbosa TaxID=529605 RepID=A0AAV1CF86_OLDCO|nr:OLC1v1029280C1 [Oldenlandia corymbosa var. corymbosa]